MLLDDAADAVDRAFPLDAELIVINTVLIDCPALLRDEIPAHTALARDDRMRFEKLLDGVRVVVRIDGIVHVERDGDEIGVLEADHAERVLSGRHGSLLVGTGRMGGSGPLYHAAQKSARGTRTRKPAFLRHPLAFSPWVRYNGIR